jgi:hypothetical protein
MLLGFDICTWFLRSQFWNLLLLLFARLKECIVMPYNCPCLMSERISLHYSDNCWYIPNWVNLFRFVLQFVFLTDRSNYSEGYTFWSANFWFDQDCVK